MSRRLNKFVTFEIVHNTNSINKNQKASNENHQNIILRQPSNLPQIKGFIRNQDKPWFMVMLEPNEVSINYVIS